MANVICIIDVCWDERMKNNKMGVTFTVTHLLQIKDFDINNICFTSLLEKKDIKKNIEYARFIPKKNSTGAEDEFFGDSFRSKLEKELLEIIPKIVNNPIIDSPKG